MPDAKTYIEYPNSDRPIEFDPIDLESPVYQGQEPYRLTVQLLRWAAPKMAEHAKTQDGLDRWSNAMGCDCAFIVEAMRGVRPINGWGKIDTRELVDVVLYVNDHGWSKLQPIYADEVPDVHTPAYEDADWILICRPFEQSIGHGLRWFEITKDQASKLLKRYQRKFAKAASG